MTYCNFYISTCGFTLMLQRQLHCFSLRNQLLGFRLFSAVSSPLSLYRIKESVCSALGFGLGECCGWYVWSSLHLNSDFIDISSNAVVLSSCVHQSSTFNFPAGTFFLHSHWLTVWCKRPNLLSVLAFNLPSPVSLTMSNFSVKVRDIWLFLLLEHLEVIVGFFFLYFWLCFVAFRILVTQPGMDPYPLQWKRGVLTAGQPGKSPQGY